jgi:ABC-type transporter Mla subunit MlaD
MSRLLENRKRIDQAAAELRTIASDPVHRTTAMKSAARLLRALEHPADDFDDVVNEAHVFAAELDLHLRRVVGDDDPFLKPFLERLLGFCEAHGVPRGE